MDCTKCDNVLFHDNKSVLASSILQNMGREILQLKYTNPANRHSWLLQAKVGGPSLWPINHLETMVTEPGKPAFSLCFAIFRCIVQCPGALRYVKVSCAMFRCFGKIPINMLTYHMLNQNGWIWNLNGNETTKPVQTLKRPPLTGGA